MSIIDAAGIRVVAISHVDEYARVYVYGHGVYEGLFTFANETPSLPRKPTLEQKLDPFTTPRIKLDNGKYIWGSMCFWVDEQEYNNNPPLEEITVDFEDFSDL